MADDMLIMGAKKPTPGIGDDIAREGVRVFSFPGAIARVFRIDSNGLKRRLDPTSDSPDTIRRRMENLIEKENFEENEKSGTADIWSTVGGQRASFPDVMTGLTDPLSAGSRSSGPCYRCFKETSPTDSRLSFESNLGENGAIVRVHKDPCTDYNIEGLTTDVPRR